MIGSQILLSAMNIPAFNLLAKVNERHSEFTGKEEEVESGGRRTEGGRSG